MKAPYLIFISLIIMGCGDTASQMQFEDADVFSKVDNEKVFCEVDPMDYDLRAKFVGFEFVSDTGMKFGYLFDRIFEAFDLSFRLSTGKATVTMDLAKTMDPNKDIVNVIGYGTHVSGEVGFNVELGDLKLGFDHYSKTPIAKLAERALKDVLMELGKDLSKGDVTWRSRVTKFIGEDMISMPAGLQSGVKVGDKFKIFNVRHDWSAAPCSSQYRGSIRTPSTPIAYAEVTDANTFYSYLKVTKLQDDPIELGAQIEVEKLKGIRRVLNRGVRIREITTGALQLGEEKINLIPYLEAQLKPKVRDHGFYLSK